MSGGTENNRYIVQVFVGALSQHYEALSVEASKQTTSEEIVSCIVERLSLADSPGGSYELAEVIGDSVGQECKERRLGPTESPVALMLLWPKILHSQQEYYRFYLREKLIDSLWTDSFTMDPQLIRDYFYRFLYQPKDREYPDLCQLPDLNELVLLDNLRARFIAGHIYTYVGSILIAVNPFKFHPIYNPKYVKLYQNRRLGPELPPHIFAVADAAYHCMLKERRNQCVVISGESGSGKTESTNFLLHHLTALSQKGSYGSGVEQTILSAGPVLEAFGNAKTSHNNNSSRFGKFIQVNYKENGMVHGAVVQKYLLEKSRICSQGRNERNYHVFYYLLAGASESEKQLLHLQKTENYNYLSKSGCYILENVDENYEFSRLKQSMEMVGFTPEKQRRLFAVLSAVLLLGNVEFQPRKSAYHHDEAVGVRNPEVVLLISELLRVKQETLLQALTAKRARASGETLVINYRLPEAVAARDAMAKCLYGALFDWIVLQVNHALLSKKDTLRDHQGNSIGVLDIFGFEDFGVCNSFEQFCINYANEHLQYYFNQHVFKYEQEEYRKEGIRWTNIDFMDNTACLQLIEGKPNGLLCLLDDQCNFPGATNETLLQKFNSVHKENNFYEIPQRREAAFIVRHYAGKVKYQVLEMREKNLDLMRQDIVGVLKNSSMAFVRELVGADPVAVFRWAIVRAFFRGYFAFHEAGRKHRLCRADGNKPSAIQSRYRNHTPNENLISFSPKHNSNVSGSSRLSYGCQKQRSTNNSESQVGLQTSPGNSHNRLSWPQFRNTNTTNPQQRIESEFSFVREAPSLPLCDSVTPMISTETGTQESTQTRRDSLNRQQGALERVLCPDEAKVLERANQIVMKNKSFRPRERGKKGLKNLQTVKTLAGRTQSYGCSNQQLGKARKQPLTVTAQFQQSLHSLMDTLNQANPFFIRCIKSNSHKIPNKFDEETVQRQLRYTGMLETVRIRQAGYNVRLTYDEFIQLYRILLPKGLVSSQADVRDFLFTLNLNRDNYQLGTSKIFLRESEKVKLDYRLHQQIMASIVAIQRWTRAMLEQRRFRRLREAVILIQSQWRMLLAQRLLNQTRVRLTAALQIQRAWRSYKASAWYRKLRSGIVVFQAHIRGYLARRRFMEAKHTREEEARHQASNMDSRSAQSTDEAFLSKESSQEELDERLEAEDRELQDSEESSGIQEDSESEFTVPESTSSAGPVGAGSRPSGPSAILSAPSSDRKALRINEPSKQSLGLEVSYSKKKISVKRSKGVKTEAKTNHRAYQEEKMSGKFSASSVTESGIGAAWSVTERKGSSDSLTSQKSIESQRSSDSQSSAPVRDTLHKAKRQIQALIGVGKRPDKWDGGIAPLVHSDGEVDETNSTTSKSAPPVITSTPSSDSFAGSDHRQEHIVWRKRPDFAFDVSDGGSSRKSIVTDSTDTSQDSRLSSTSSSEMCFLAPVVRRESKLSHQEAAAAFLFAEQRNRTLKTSISHDEQRSLHNPDPEVPVRMARRQRSTREILCRSVGEELTDNASADPASNPVFLGTIRESSISSDGNSAGENRTMWASRKAPRSSDGSESSYAGRLSSSQEAESSPDLDNSTYIKSGLQIHSVATKRSRSGAITSLELKRRNSDPATKCGLLITGQPSGMDTPTKVSDVLEWKGTMFTIAGHRFRKVARFSKEDKCISCDKPMDAFVTQGHKCSDCKQLFHTKCIQNGGILRIPCQQQQSAPSVRRNKYKSSRTQHDLVKPAPGSKFNLTGTSEFTDSTDKIISDATELQFMQDFITQKIYKIESEEGKKPSEVDRVFKQALREFKDNLVATYSVMNKQGAEGLNIKYKDLIANFLHVMETVCNQEQTREDFPVTMGVNAFRGFMNEFMNRNRLEEKPNKAKRKKEKKRKIEDPIAYAGHTFLLTIINIPTACEICTSFFMWPIERGLVCQNCKLTCHKKCYSKVTVMCGKDAVGSSNQEGSRVFGVPLHQLAVGDGKVPIVVDRLITTIEMYGLYTEGIYRKSGVSSKVKELKFRMEEGNVEGVNFENYQVHVLAAVLKSFFRDMSEPLLTFDSYEDFLRAANLTDPQDRVSTLFTILKKLPKPNFDLMERLIFHLARVALHEDANRMNASALAIVFAPCILRTNKIVPAQDSLHDIGRQTQCIETIVTEQLRKVRSTLADIDTLDTACHTATHRLSSLRSSKVFSPEELLPVDISNSDPKPALLNPDDEEALLMGHIQEIQKEKALLTSALPSLTRTTSDDDLLSTDIDDGSLDDVTSHLEEGHHGRRARGTPGQKSVVSRSMSGGDGESSSADFNSKVLHQSSAPVRLKRQSSSDNSVVSLYPPIEVDCDEDPIMV
ncbi:unconventional myosin-IXa-like isoform X3 [Zootermopsis nevadensis]|uniref:unconventional myosin-IXa-like isoform X3 n=1 Tax=Zootermopsis nevadensis TaxID=136037 RepID=UPI000B8EC8E9|nr:unconventional myosin-IXa-like isoform X3 [Zootermopsis nevadensis]